MSTGALIRASALHGDRWIPTPCTVYAQISVYARLVAPVHSEHMHFSSA